MTAKVLVAEYSNNPNLLGFLQGKVIISGEKWGYSYVFAFKRKSFSVE